MGRGEGSALLLARSVVEPETVTAFELAVFRAFNDAPDFLFRWSGR